MPVREVSGRLLILVMSNKCGDSYRPPGTISIRSLLLLQIGITTLIEMPHTAFTDSIWSLWHSYGRRIYLIK